MITGEVNARGTLSGSANARKSVSGNLQMPQFVGGGSSYNIGDGLTLDPVTNTLSVDIANAVTEGDGRPVSSAAVYVEVGNINAILRTI